LSGIRRYGAPLIATAVLAGGTALGMAGNNQPQRQQLFRATAGDRPSAEPPSRDFERQPRVTRTGSCAASFYWEPQSTANGETFDPEALTAAHKSLPFHTRVRVTNPANGKSVTVRVNDRGPYIDGRCLDLSRAAFRAIADLETGVLRSVKYEVLG